MGLQDRQHIHQTGSCVHADCSKERCSNSTAEFVLGLGPIWFYALGVDTCRWVDEINRMVDCCRPSLGCNTSTKLAVAYMQTVAKRDAATLLPIIQKVVRPGSIVYSDEWRAYRQIQPKLGLQHETVNHSVNFSWPWICTWSWPNMILCFVCGRL
jgi:hypothetical protein